MIVTCYSCSTSFKLDDALVKPEGTKVRCSRCKHFFILYPPDPETGQQPIPRHHARNADNLNEVRDNLLPDLEFEESEFSHLNLSGYELDDDLAVIEELISGPPLTSESPAELDNGQISDQSDEDSAELELEFGSLEIELENDIASNGAPPLSLDTDDLEMNAPENHVRFEDDDPEFELEFSPDIEVLPPIENPDIESLSPIERSDMAALEKKPGITSTLTESSPPDTEKKDMDNLLLDTGKQQRTGFMFKKPLIILIPCLLIIVVASAIVAGRMTGYKIPFISDLSFFNEDSARKEAVLPVLNRNDVTGRFVDNVNSGKLFIISGKVRNPSTQPYSHIQVKASLLDEDQTSLETGFAFCGNMIPEEMLKNGNIKDIMAALTVKKGIQASNINIKPGQSIPYMIVFSNVSSKHESFTVQVSSYESQ